MVPDLRCSLRIRNNSLTSISITPTSHTTPSTLAMVRFSEMITPTEPITPIGLAHDKCAVQTRSRIAPRGNMKLSDVATQIQYFVVALPARKDVSAHAANQTIEAYSRCTSK